MKTVIIIGAGWYGCHIANILQNNYNIIIIEKEKDIFINSSYYNQNRLHLGYHYCRDYETRSLCKNNYENFKKKYNNLIDIIDNNYYGISKESFIDYQTYINIYDYEKFNFCQVDNNIFINLQNKLIKVDEQVINSDRTYNYFCEKLKNIKIIFNTKFLTYIKYGDVISITCIDKNNNQQIYKCDILLDCTYNQAKLSKKIYNYELTISLLFKKIMNTNFGAITIMDGKFMSLYPRNIDENIYTLTDVELTPIISSENYDDIENYILTNEKIILIKEKMIEKFMNYYDKFLEHFEYQGFFISKKTKQKSNSDSRGIIIDELDVNVISVNCGKIYGIFYFEDYIKKKYL